MSGQFILDVSKPSPVDCVLIAKVREIQAHLRHKFGEFLRWEEIPDVVKTSSGLGQLERVGGRLLHLHSPSLVLPSSALESSNNTVNAA